MVNKDRPSSEPFRIVNAGRRTKVSHIQIHYYSEVISVPLPFRRGNCTAQIDKPRQSYLIAYIIVIISMNSKYVAASGTSDSIREIMGRNWRIWNITSPSSFVVVNKFIFGWLDLSGLVCQQMTQPFSSWTSLLLFLLVTKNLYI